MFNKLKKHSLYLVLALIILASTWALFRPDFFRFHDFTQGARIVEMTNALKDGHFPVVWSANLGFGYGMPLFEFYAPFPYYIGSLFYLAGFSLINSVKAIIFISSFFTAVGAFLLGKKLYGNWGGLLVSSAITLAPYRAVNLFVRGAVSEAWGIMALPFILLGIIKTIKNEKYGWLLLVVSILVLLLSHNLTALIFLPLSVVFGAGYLILETKTEEKNRGMQLASLTRSECLFQLKSINCIPQKKSSLSVFAKLKHALKILYQRRALTQDGGRDAHTQVAKFANKNFWSIALKLAGLYLLAVLLSSFYTIPAFLEKDFTRLEATILADYFNYKLHFVGIKQFFTDNWGYGGSTYGPLDGISFYLGFGQLLGLFLSVYIIVKKVIALHGYALKTLYQRRVLTQDGGRDVRTQVVSIKNIFASTKNNLNKHFTTRIFSKHFSLIKSLKCLFKFKKNKSQLKLDNKTLMYLLTIFLFGVSLLMTTNKSMFIWENLSILAFLQFPWRYLSSAIIFLGLAIGALSNLLPNKYFKYIYTVTLISTMLIMNSQYFQPEEFTSNLSQYYYSDANKLRTDMSKTLPDYIPSQIEQKEIKPVALEGQVLYCEVLENCEKQLGIIKIGGVAEITEINNVLVADNITNSFEILENKVHKKTIKTNFAEEKEVVFATAYFPGWAIKIDGKNIKTQHLEYELISDASTPFSKEGFIKALIPAGEHLVNITLENTLIRKTANLVSILGLVILLAIFFWYDSKND